MRATLVGNTKGRLAALAMAGFASLAAETLPAQNIIEPPFGLRWGDSPEKLVSWSVKHSLDLNIFIPGDQPGTRVLRVSPRSGLLPDSPASAVEAGFLNGGLYEVTVHYRDPAATAEMMEERFDKLRKQLAGEHGALTANQQKRMVEDQFVTRTVSFHREPMRGVFLLIAWTEVEDLLRKTKEARFSLIYRNDNFMDELRKKAVGNE